LEQKGAGKFRMPVFPQDVQQVRDREESGIEAVVGLPDEPHEVLDHGWPAIRCDQLGGDREHVDALHVRLDPAVVRHVLRGERRLDEEGSLEGGPCLLVPPDRPGRSREVA
jgi:hypothetical protein